MELRPIEHECNRPNRYPRGGTDLTAPHLRASRCPSPSQRLTTVVPLPGLRSSASLDIWNLKGFPRFLAIARPCGPEADLVATRRNSSARAPWNTVGPGSEA